MSDVDFSALQGDFKEAYADKLKDLVPDFAKLLKMVAFEKGSKQLGNLYHQPVKVTSGQGYTYNNDGSAFAINPAIALVLKDAQIQGTELLRKDTISYNAISRSSGKNAFTKAVDLTIDDMVAGMSRRLENMFLYGGEGLAVCASSANDDTTHTTITITTASWAGGSWAGSENTQLQFYTAVDALVSSGADSIFSVVLVDTVARTIQVSGTTTGISALDTAISTPGVKAFYRGAHGVESTGLASIVSNTGELFNIDGAAYSLWSGNSYSASSAALTFGKLSKAIQRAVDKGLTEDVTVFVSTPAWANLVNDQAAARRYDSSYSSKKLENGTEGLEFFIGGVKAEVIAHPLVKEADAFIVPIDSLYRIGSTDVTFKMPGTDVEMFVQANGVAGYEVRCYSDQALFCDAPSHGVRVTAIVN